jgi:hypothetical protein
MALSKKLSRLSGGGGGGVASLERYYQRTLVASGDVITTGQYFITVIPKTGTIKQIEAEVYTDNGSDVVFNVNKNATTLGAVTVSDTPNGVGGPAKYISETVSYSVTAGDEIIIDVTSNGSGSSGLVANILFE